MSPPIAAATRRARWLPRLLLGLLAVLLLAGASLYLLLRASLPTLDARLSAAGATRAPVRIERDSRGAVTVRGASQADVAYGLGFAHAQDRYFQMDLSRRLAAGELAELFGPTALPQDRSARVFGFRAVARAVVGSLSEVERGVLDAYTRGVNAGLEGLDSRPWEYWLLRQRPAPWRPEDSILVVHAMWWQLQYGSFEVEAMQRAIAAQFSVVAASASGSAVDAGPAEFLRRFLFPRGTDWDSPNFQSLADERSAAAALESVALPPPSVLDLRRNGARSPDAVPFDPDKVPRPPPLAPAAGSNNWALAGALAAGGAALIANDMHLGLGVPAVWYHARLVVEAPPAHDVVGVSLAGVPVIVAGSNGHVAWGFTNSYGDWTDVDVVSCDVARGEYRTQAGPQRFTRRVETLRVRGADAETLEVLSTPLGVLIQAEPAERRCLLARWPAMQPGATNVTLGEMQGARDLDAALEIGARSGIPHQNMVIGDRSGRIAWLLAGRIPDASAASGWRDPELQPRIVDPEAGMLVTANARPVDGELEREIGGDEAAIGAGYDLGARASQIRAGLRALDRPATPADMLAVQLDDRALFLTRWRTLLLGVLDEEALKNAPQRVELKRWVEQWGARATPDSVGYRIVRRFRDRVEGSVWSMLMQGIGMPPDTALVSRQFEGPLWRLVSEQPPHLLDPARAADWRAFLLAEIDALARELRESCGALERCTWGEARPVEIRHPLSRALPWLAGLLDMPTRQLPGDADVPRVQSGAFGASQRFAISPGREAEAYLQLPGGQSGHPLSRFYRASFESWAEGKPEPLLPGPPQHVIEVIP
jgi:penicillin amidase